eukprot:6173087-Pleurochrysis_carterae.AAC.2
MPRLGIRPTPNISSTSCNHEPVYRLQRTVYQLYGLVGHGRGARVMSEPLQWSYMLSAAVQLSCDHPDGPKALLSSEQNGAPHMAIHKCTQRFLESLMAKVLASAIKSGRKGKANSQCFDQSGKVMVRSSVVLVCARSKREQTYVAAVCVCFQSLRDCFNGTGTGWAKACPMYPLS